MQSSGEATSGGGGPQLTEHQPRAVVESSTPDPGGREARRIRAEEDAEAEHPHPSTSTHRRSPDGPSDHVESAGDKGAILPEERRELWSCEADEVADDALLRSPGSLPELDEEQLSFNDQQQEDELLAMESIYGDNAVVGLRSIQIHIHIETEETFTIRASLNSPDDNLSRSFEVQCLPPIVLTLVLPKSYPSHHPPQFTVSVQWLDPVKISDLCSVLDSIWMEQPGQEVIYRWADWLQSSCLSYLGFQREITLGPYGVRSVADERAISGSVSVDVDIPSIRRYDAERCQEKFLMSLQECCICCSEFAGTVNKLKCPNAKCGEMIPPDVLKRLLDDRVFQLWESLMLRRTLDSMSDVVYCPRCETPSIEDDDQHALCARCFFSFCTVCRDRRHVGAECLSPEVRLRLLQECGSSYGLSEDQKVRERQLINELLSLKEVFRDAKQCPSCKIAISRTEGCNKMECRNCGQIFCYRCNQRIIGYDHYSNGRCQLFSKAQIQLWEAMMMMNPG